MVLVAELMAVQLINMKKVELVEHLLLQGQVRLLLQQAVVVV